MRKTIILVLILSAVIGTGCLGRGTPTSTPETQEAETVPTTTQVPEVTPPTATPQPTNTPDPTSTPSPAPTPTPEPTTAPEEPETSEDSRAHPSPIAMPDLVDVIWQWAELHDPEGQSAIADPENYVLVFASNGTFTVKADCNTGKGTYTLEADRLVLGPIALTRALCQKGSRSDQYVKLLGSADTVAIAPETGDLVVTLKDGAGEMVFDPMGKAKVPADPCAWIVDVLWRWERFDDQAEENDVEVDDPSQYTLQLLPDSTFRFKADCNVGNGTYTCGSGSRLTLELGPTTLAECGPDSLYDEYLGKIQDVASFVMDEGKLVLNLKADAGNLVFGQESQ